MKYVFTLLVLLWCGVVSAFTANDGARTILTDGTSADTQAAENYVINKAQSGWVMTIGSVNGRYTWSSQVNFNNTNFNVISGANGVIVTNAAGPNHTWDFTCYPVPNYTIFSNISLTTDGTGPSAEVVLVKGRGECFRISAVHTLNAQMPNKFVWTFSNSGLGVGGPYGVIDHCTNVATGGGPGLYDLQDQGIGSWSQPMTFGTVSVVCLEDVTAMCDNNSNQGAGFIDGYNGARFAMRHCYLTNYTMGWHGENSGPGVSLLQAEVYTNIFDYPYAGGSFAVVINPRGGTFNIFGNTVNTYGSNPLGQVFNCWDECASTQWAVEHCPSQLMYPADYPSIQQVGQGVVGGVQGLVPGYGSNNKLNGTAVFAFWGLGLDSGDAPFIQQGRDVFTNSVMPGYTALVYPHPLVSSSSLRIARVTTLRAGKTVVGP